MTKSKSKKMPAKKQPGRPRGKGANVEMIAAMKIGDSIFLPATADEPAILQSVRNRFYNPASRLGMKLSFQIENNQVRIRREA